MERKDIIESLLKSGIDVDPQLDSLPAELPSDPLAPGFHIMQGGPGSGKTVLALAWSLQLRKEGVASSYQSIMEPRGRMLAITQKQTVKDSSKSVAQEAEGQQESSEATEHKHLLYQRFFDYKCYQLKKVSNGKRVPVLFLDSVTYLVKGLTVTQAALEKDKGPTFPEGLSFGDVLGVLHHTLRAMENGVAVVGVINSQLYPVVDKLRGACEGTIIVTSPQEARRNSRATSRMDVPLSIEPWAIKYARALLGYRPGGIDVAGSSMYQG